MALIDNALTTLERVKTKLEIQSTDYDATLEIVINEVSIYIENFCSRKFLEQSYTDIYNGSDIKTAIFLRQFPVTSVTSFKYRSGTVSTPAWTDFDADNYELDGLLDALTIYVPLPSGRNNIQVIYDAGYKIDFSKIGDSAFHTLPLDLSMACESIVVKAFLMRKSQGKASESFEGANIDWNEQTSTENKNILTKYQKVIL